MRSATLVVLTLVAGVLLLPGLVAGPSLDPAVFTTVAERLRGGEALYVGAWDHKPPGIYLIYVLGQWVLPSVSPWHVAWGIAVAATSATGAVLVAALRRLDVGSIVALLAAVAAVAFMAEYLLALGGGLTEPLATLPAVIALYLATGSMIGSRRSFAIGACLALAMLISLQLVIAASVLAALTLTRLPKSGRVTGLLALVTGGAIPIGATAIWLAASGTLGASIDAVLGYAASYRAANVPLGAELTRSVVSWTVLAAVGLLLPAALGAMRSVSRPGVRRPIAMSASVWVVASVAFFVAQGRFIAHYAIPLAVPLAVLAAFGLERTWSLAKSRPRRSEMTLIMLPLTLGLAISIAAAVAGGLMEWRTVLRDHQRSEQVAEFMASEGPSSATVFVWGNQPRLYLDARSVPTTAYAFLYPLTTRGYSDAAQVDDLVSTLANHPPTFVVDAGSSAPGEPGFLPLLIPRPVATDGRDLDLLEPVRDFVKQHYRQLAVVDGWVVYGLET